MPIRFRLNPTWFFAATLTCLCLLIIGNLISVYALLHLKKDSALGIIPLFNFDQEANLPTLFNTLLLISAAILAFLIGKWRISQQGPDGWRWIGIAAILGFLSVDENAGIHEQIDFILMDRLDTSGAIAWPWVIPYLLLTIGVGIAYLPFLFRLPWRYKLMFVISGAVYAIAALGFEMLESRHAEVHGLLTITYAVLYTLEETLEMTAVIAATGSMMGYLRDECPGFSTQITIADRVENRRSAMIED